MTHNNATTQIYNPHHNLDTICTTTQTHKRQAHTTIATTYTTGNTHTTTHTYNIYHMHTSTHSTWATYVPAHRGNMHHIKPRIIICLLQTIQKHDTYPTNNTDIKRQYIQHTTYTIPLAQTENKHTTDNNTHMYNIGTQYTNNTHHIYHT